MEDVYKNLSGPLPALWKLKPSDKSHKTHFLATEIWLHRATNAIVVESATVHEKDFASWFGKASRGDEAATESLVLRLVHVEFDSEKKTLDLADNYLQQVLLAFNLTTAYQYSQSCVTGITEFPLVKDATGQHQKFSISYAPKIAALWSMSTTTSTQPPPTSVSTTTCGIVFTQNSPAQPASDLDKQPPKQKQTPTGPMRRLLQAKWSAELVRNPMFIALLLCISLSAEIDGTLHGMKDGLRGVEGTTNYHSFVSRRSESTDKVSLEPLFEKTNGWAGKLASIERKGKTVVHLLNFIGKKCEFLATQKMDSQAFYKHAEAVKVLRRYVYELQERRTMQQLDRDYTLKRVQIQIDALHNIITQNDSALNLLLAKSTQQVAYDSYWDSQSMKTLAVVTMFFLPGSFVSSLFSTDLFHWDGVDLRSGSITVPATPQLALYWVITIPLTLATFTLYFIWLTYQKWERTRKYGKPELDRFSNGNGNGSGGGIRHELGTKLFRPRRETTLINNKNEGVP